MQQSEKVVLRVILLNMYYCTCKYRPIYPDVLSASTNAYEVGMGAVNWFILDFVKNDVFFATKTYVYTYTTNKCLRRDNFNFDFQYASRIPV